MGTTADIDALGPIEIRPEVTMLSVLRHLPYKPWFAISEFIDNSLQSYLANKDRLEALHGPTFRLKVHVEIDTTGPGVIVVTDNAAGISAAAFPRAFRAAQVPLDQTGLSEFGMGMKSAACWFAEKWSVRTKAIDEPVERTIDFDVRDIVDNNIESLPTDSRLIASTNTHYTVITLRGLHHVPRTKALAKIKDHLASIYRMFLRDGRLTLEVNQMPPLVYEAPPILEAKRYVAPWVVDETDAHAVVWRKDINFDFGMGQNVRGFAALRASASTSLAGFALFRRDRLIEGSHDETYRPPYIFKQTNSYTYQRLFGELHVEGFEVSHTKDGFRWEDNEELFLGFLKEKLTEAPLDLIAQAENYRTRTTKKSIEAAAEAATTLAVDYIKRDVGPLLQDAQAHVPVAPPVPPTLLASTLQASERVVSVDDGAWLWQITLRTSVDPARENWVSLAMQDSSDTDPHNTRRLIIDVSLIHPFSSEFLGANNENVELFLRIAIAVCVSLTLTADHTELPPSLVLLHLNNLLRGALRHADLS